MAWLNISQQLGLNDKCEEDVDGKHVGQIRQILPDWRFRLLAVLTENSIALQERERHASGNEFLGLRKHLSNRRVVNDPPYRLPGQRITAAGSMYI